jgi:DNA-directed RNA polymerase subunit RPC12/RpoP
VIEYNKMTLTSDEVNERGLFSTWVYYCLRCGYLWLPRGYDPSINDIETMQPPKACARCKSRAWNKLKIQN